MTDLDVIKDAVLTINSIQVPIEYKEQIADPLYRVGRNLDELYRAILNQIRKEQEQEQEIAEPEEAAEDVPEDSEGPDPE